VLRQLPLGAPPTALCAITAAAGCRLNCCMALCCSANGTRCTAAGVLRLKKCVFSELRGMLATALLEYRRLAAVGASGNWPRTKPASRICEPVVRAILPNLPCRKSAAVTEETPFATRALRYALATLALVMLAPWLKYAALRKPA
jgi:hypothetical protein